MVLNADNALIAGSDYDSFWLAPYGSSLPATIDETPGVGFEDVGWLHADGITESFTGSKSEIRGHQGQRVVRTRIETPGTTLAFHALEDKAQTNALRYDEKSVSVSNGVRKTVRGAGQKVKVRTAVVDIFDEGDATRKTRLLIPRLAVTANGDRVYAGTDIAGFPFIGEIIGDYETLSTEGVGRTDTDWDVSVTGTPSGGTYRLIVNGYQTPGIAFGANAAAVKAAIDGMQGMTGVTVTASGAIKLVFSAPVTLAADGSGLSGGTNPGVTVAPSV